jgi:hypothetical protein
MPSQSRPAPSYNPGNGGGRMSGGRRGG